MTTTLDDILAVRDALLRRDLSSFIQKTYYEISGGRSYLHNWHVEAIAWHLEQVHQGKITRLIITLPPRHLKSICCSVAYPAWVLGHDPGCRIITVSHSADLAGKHARDFRLIMQSPWYRGLFPRTRPDPKKNTELEFVTTRQGYRYSNSIGGPLTGRGGNLFIIDDPLKAEDAWSDVRRSAVNEFFDTTLYSRLDSKEDDKIIIVMQRLHVDDLVGHVLQRKDWVHLNIPAIAEGVQTCQIGPGEFYTRQPGDVLHAERESPAVLKRIKQQIGSYNFAAQYLQSPEPPGGGLIQREWLQFYTELPTRQRHDRIVQSWDTASTPGDSSDYSVCTTWHVHDNRYYLLDVVRERLSYPHLKRRVISEAERHQADVVLIENKASGISLIQELQEEGELLPIAIQPEGDKITRLVAQSAKIEAGYVLLPKNAPWLGELITEMMQFPHGRHDDQVDSISQFLGWISIPEPRPRMRFV